MTVWIGLTGGIGSGKSSVSAEFGRLGVPVIDADRISHMMTADGGMALPLLRSAFGSGIFDEQGRLNRMQLRQRVFENRAEKSRLESILLPLVLQEMMAQKKQYPQAVYGVMDVPLLIEKPEFLKLVDRVLVVDAPDSLRIDRVRRRNGWSESEVERVINGQIGRRDRLLHADDVLVNDGDFECIREKVGRLHGFYRSFFSQNLSDDRINAEENGG